MQTMKHRLSLLGVLAGLVAIVALTYVALPAIVAEAGQGAGSALTLNVVVDGASFDMHDAAGHGDGPFYIKGDIVDGDGVIIGTFDCWGWGLADGPPFVSQEYNLFGRGAIQTQGNEGSESIAVVGGTGEFNNVRGEAIYTPTDVAGFARRFQLQGG